MTTGRWVLATVLLAAPLAAGCSNQSQDGYCAALAEEKKTLDGTADQPDAAGKDTLTETVQAFERLQAAAPDDLQDEWETVVVAYQALVDAVDAAGIDPSDYDPKHPPADLSKGDAHELAAVAGKLASPRVTAATTGIEDHAQAVCHVDFAS